MHAESRLDGGTLVVRIPMRLGRQRGRKRILAPDGSELTPPTKPQPDGVLVKALARARLRRAERRRHADVGGRGGQGRQRAAPGPGLAAVKRIVESKEGRVSAAEHPGGRGSVHVAVVPRVGGALRPGDRNAQTPLRVLVVGGSAAALLAWSLVRPVMRSRPWTAPRRPWRSRASSASTPWP